MTRLPHVELTERSIAIDGRDISESVYAVTVNLHVDHPPVVEVHHHAHLLTFTGDALVRPHPYDGIERLRARFGVLS